MNIYRQATTNKQKILNKQHEDVSVQATVLLVTKQQLLILLINY